MFKHLAFLTLALGVVGCDQPVSYSGINMDDYFPFDGERTWEFVSTDTTLPYKLVGTLDTEPEFAREDATQIFSVAYGTECVAETDPPCVDESVRSVRWSSDRTYGTYIWGFETDAGVVDYDPPIMITEGQQLVGEAIETTTGGKTWTSTFIEIGPCPVVWTAEWGDRCIHIHLDDGDGDDTVGEYLAGHYYAITQYNVVAMELTQDTGEWQLSNATYTWAD